MAFEVRISKEIDQILKNQIPGVRAEQDKDNFRVFIITFDGPKGSPYEGGQFKLEMIIPVTYPMTPPVVHFLTRIYHPNVNTLGGISLSLLDDKWSPCTSICAVLSSIKALLSSPELEQNNLLTAIWKVQPIESIIRAREWTLKYAKNAAANPENPSE